MSKCTPIPWQSIAESGEVPVLLVRHGRTSANVERRFAGKMDVPLDAHGRNEAALWATRMRHEEYVALYSSNLVRARETAAYLSEPVPVDSLQELDQGVLEGKRFEEIDPALLPFFEAWKKDPTDVCVPEGESLGACRDRALQGLNTLLQAHEPGPPVIVVTHQMVMASLVLTALDLPLRFVHLVKHGNTAMDLLGWTPENGLRVHRLNDVEHLVSHQ